MSGTQDMNNRMKQNRNLRPSKRSKFKVSIRKTIYAGVNNTDKPNLKEFSEFQTNKAIDKIKKEAKSKQRRELIFIILFFGIIGLLITYTIISSKDNVEKPEAKESSIDYDTNPPIIWSGKQSDPLELPFSTLYYSPVIGNLDFEVQIEKRIEIYSSSMVVDNTTNILFFDSKCNLISKLLTTNGNISWMYVGPKKEGLEPKKIVYSLTKKDSNNDGLINDHDQHYLFISDLNGKSLIQITDKSVLSMQWIGSRNELFLKFDSRDKKKDSLYGIFNTKTKKLSLTNQNANKKSNRQQSKSLINSSIPIF